MEYFEEMTLGLFKANYVAEIYRKHQQKEFQVLLDHADSVRPTIQ